MFSQCDPAGIVFFPHYFIMLNDLVEDWFRDGLGFEMVNGYLAAGYGLPTVHLEYDFHNSSRAGDVLDQRLAIERIGRSSITLRVDFSCAGAPRFSGKSVLVATDQATSASVSIPPILETRLNAFLNQSVSPAP